MVRVRFFSFLLALGLRFGVGLGGLVGVISGLRPRVRLELG